jgi:hypothetical protein
MIVFLAQDVRVNEMAKTNNRYIPLNVRQVGHFWAPKIHSNLSDYGVTLDGSRHFVHIFKVVNNVVYKGVLDPNYHRNRHLSSRVATEHNSTMGKSVNDIHLCKNLKLGL